MINRPCCFLVVLVFSCLALALAAEESPELPADPRRADASLTAALGMDLGWENDQVFDSINAALSWSGGPATLTADMSLVRDGVYPAESSYTLDHYFSVNEGSLGLDFDVVSARLGRFESRDVIDSPYSVFVSSNLPAGLGAELEFEGGGFSYLNRWTMLNARSKQVYADGLQRKWRDRGMNFKAYGLDIGDARFGFEDSIVYLDRFFDAEYFLNPLPMFMMELITTSAHRPWVEENNPNSLMGFFFEWERDGLYLSSQLLVDDINASFLAPLLGKWIPSLNRVDNLNKLAFSLGGRYLTPYGRFSLFFAGASKYTYEATYAYDYYSDLPYEYVLYPAVEYSKFGPLAALDYTENYLGYLYGENNLALRFDFDRTFFRGDAAEFDFLSSLEWVVNGAKSPANPWHEYEDWHDIGPATEWLDGEVLEHIVRLTVEAGKVFGGWRFGFSGTFGWVFNALDFVNSAAPADEPKIYTPNPLVDKAILQLSLGAAYLIGD